MSRNVLWACAIAALAAIGWAYWPTFADTAAIWEREADYSHGYLVIPIALYILWARKEKLASISIQPSVWGFVLLAASIGLRYAGTRYYLDPLEHLSLIMLIAAVVALIGGTGLLKWSLPAIVFLLFMFPLPFRIEHMFSRPLQAFATQASTWLLQSAGQPAFATGNVISLQDYKIEVVQACSGLRMIVSFLALCTAYAILCQRRLWERALIVLSSLPIAVICNVMRITVTGFLYRLFNAEVAQKFTHDIAGYAMAPAALLLLLGGLWYLDHLFVEAEVAESTILVRNAKST